MPKCHFKEMEHCAADDGNGSTVYWFECVYCGHTIEIGTEVYNG